MSRRVRWGISLCCVLLSVSGLRAYLKLGSELNGRVTSVRWSQFPVRYFVTNRGVPGVSPNAFVAAVQRAFSTWAAQPLVSLSSEFVGFTDAEPFVEDGASVIGFRPRPDLDRTLAATTFSLDEITGELRESDILFNSAFDWSTAAAGDPDRYDVEAIALHELGHLLGLSHSGLGETELLAGGDRRVLGKGAVMFPIAFPPGSVRDRTLQPDDIAGLDDLYSTPTSRRQLGSIDGHVTRAGQGVFGAHVTAFNPTTQVTIGTFTLTTQGDFVIAGLEPGVYILRAEPLDDADIDSFFDDASVVNTNFKPAYAPRLATVPPGGSGPDANIAVTSR